MKPASAKEIRDALKHRSDESLIHIINRLARFKKENKELLTYLLFEADDESFYIQNVKDHVDELWAEMNTDSLYFMKKTIRKCLKIIRKHIRFSGENTTEVELLVYFIGKLKNCEPSVLRNTSMSNLYFRLIQQVKKKIGTLTSDLQHDYSEELREITSL